MKDKNLKKEIWINEIIKVMQLNGGFIHLKDLYKEIKNRGNINFYNLLENPNANIRAIIEAHSSDSKKYTIKNKDLFYSVFGKGKGYWGLREYNYNNNYDLITNSYNYEIEGKEGKKIFIQHIKKERNTTLIKIIKENYKRENGRLFCQVCKFDFEEHYGDRGKDFIEAHHIVPISKLDGESITRAKDIILLCSNCHSMIHRNKPWLSIEELSNLLNCK